MSETLGLYLHIPFCVRKCAYCDFYSLPQSETGGDDSVYRRYTDALLLHMEDYAQAASDRMIDTVFIGGGTPTVLPIGELCEIVEGVFRHFTVLDRAEITVECNPATVTPTDLKRLRRAGVNRLSIGLQSASDAELNVLGRIHTREEFLETFEAARKAGFDNINVDLMYGIPDQTPQSLADTLTFVCGLEPEHISLYNLILEAGTPMGDHAEKLNLPDEDTEFAMYGDAIAYLESAGYHQYEISNFARDGYECRHNLRYWNCEEYIGLGPAAHSYFNDLRFSFKRDAGLYIKTLESSDPVDLLTDECYEVRDDERVGEYIMLQFRLKQGLSLRAFSERFRLDFEAIYGDFLRPYVEGGFVTRDNGRYAFTVKGMYVSNYILSSMLDFEGGMADQISRGRIS